MNYLQAVFWEDPELTTWDAAHRALQKAKTQGTRRWLMQRFLEHGRAMDALSLFSIEMIAQELPTLNLQPYTRKKWQRLVESMPTELIEVKNEDMALIGNSKNHYRYKY